MIEWFARTKEIDLLGPFDTQIEAWKVLIDQLGENSIPPLGSMVWPAKSKTKKIEQVLHKDVTYPYMVKRR